jgi:HEAT repeat protein
MIVPGESRKPVVDDAQPVTALVAQFRNEKAFWRQFEIGQAIADKRDATVLPALAGWLHHDDRHIRGNVAFIFARLGDPRGLQTIADILHDRTARPEGHGIPTASSDGRYHVERQVASDRYYAAHLLGDVRDPRGVDLLVPLLADPETQSIVPNDDPSMRVLIIYALEELRAKEAIPRLRTLVHDKRTSTFGALVSVSEAAKGALATLQ